MSEPGTDMNPLRIRNLALLRRLYDGLASSSLPLTLWQLTAAFGEVRRGSAVGVRGIGRPTNEALA
ncbi:MAG: hypothetical protein ABI620_08090, partial [Chloroflexota bacterium]